MADSSSPLWRVTAQQETVDLAENGRYVNGTQVTFRTRSGAMGSIFVPQAEYTPAAVAAKLNQFAADLETVHTMVPEE